MENRNRNLTIHESDERMFFLKQQLCGTKPSVPTHIFAPNVRITSALLEDVEDGCTVIGGKCDEEAVELANSRDIRLCNMMENERFQAVNARLTAEGTLAVLISHSLVSIKDMRVLILGFGRTGAAVARILGTLGTKVDVATTASVRPAYAFADNVIAMHGFNFAEYDAVVNTVPYPVVPDKEVISMKQAAVYIDLASKPAVNLEYARYLGVDADIYPALPAKTCPVSAAAAMKDYIMEVLV